VQPFVKKCFEAVKELVFESNGEISGMISQEGEKITFTERVNPATSGTHECCTQGCIRYRAGAMWASTAVLLCLLVLTYQQLHNTSAALVCF
jgi:hypothetical protein